MVLDGCIFLNYIFALPSSICLGCYNHIDVQLLKIDLGSFLELLAWFLKLGGRGLVGYVMLPLRFGLSQAFRLRLVVF